MSSSYNTPCIKHKLVVRIYSNTETSLSMSTFAIWRRVVQSRDVRSRVFSRPNIVHFFQTGEHMIMDIDTVSLYHVSDHLRKLARTHSDGSRKISS